jgi:hypothetical protein
VDAAASAREARAGRVVPVSPRPRVDERRCEVRRANIFPLRRQRGKPCGANGRAYGKTVWSWPSLLRSSLSRRCARAQPGGRHRQFAGRGRPKGTRLPGEHGISRQTIAQGRPCVGLHLYAAVRSLCATSSRSGPRVPPAPGLPCALGEEGGETRQCSGEMRREDAKARLPGDSVGSSWRGASCTAIIASDLFPFILLPIESSEDK